MTAAVGRSVFSGPCISVIRSRASHVSFSETTLQGSWCSRRVGDLIELLDVEKGNIYTFRRDDLRKLLGLGDDNE